MEKTLYDRKKYLLEFLGIIIFWTEKADIHLKKSVLEIKNNSSKNNVNEIIRIRNKQYFKAIEILELLSSDDSFEITIVERSEIKEFYYYYNLEKSKIKKLIDNISDPDKALIIKNFQIESEYMF